MYEYRCNVVHIVDGDTVDVDIDLGFGVWMKKQRIRLSGIDAPEINQSCKKIFLSIQFLSFHKKYPCGKISTKKLKKLLKNALEDLKISFKSKYKHKKKVKN